MSKTFSKLSGSLVYVAVNEPVKAFVKAGEAPKPNEWKASVVIGNEDLVDEFEEYATSVGAKVSVKKVKTAEFADKYKCEPPEDAGKNTWVITFRKSTELGKTGKPVPDQFKPRIYLESEENGKILRQDITATQLVGNGSKGTVSIDKFVRDNGTVSFYLKNVLIIDLVEYVKPEGSTANYVPGSEFDDDDDSDAPEAPVEPPKAAVTRKAAPAKKTAPAAEPDANDPPPF